MEQRLAQAHEDKQAAEVERDSLRRGKERLTAEVKTLEREAQRARGGKALGPKAEGEAKSPTAERVGGGGGNPAGTRFLAGVHAWHAQAKAAHGPISAVAKGLRMVLLQGNMEMEVWTVAADLGKVQQSHVQLVQQSPPPPPPRHSGGVGRQLPGGGAELPGFRRLEFYRRGRGVVVPLTS